MKRHVLLLVSILIFSLFTGCTSDFKVNEVIVKNISDKITQTVIETLDSDIKAEKQETQTLDSINSTELIVKSEVGDIEIITHDSDKITIDADTKIKSNTKERAENLVQSFRYLAVEKGGEINIDTTEYDEKTNDDEVTVNLIIKIPKSITKLSVSSNVGDIKFENVNGTINAITNVGNITTKNSSASYEFTTGVGNINVENSSISGKSEFYLNVGDIILTNDDISAAKSLLVETKVGNIKISLIKNSNYQADIYEYAKEPKIESVGTGKTKIKLVTNVGSIDFE
jgi:hypothetical protein